MKTIELTQGQVALVDDADYEAVSQFKWYAVKGGRSKTFYAFRSVLTPKGRRPQSLHSFLLGSPPSSGLVTDHRDGNGSNNKRENLRWVSQKGNSRNSRKRVPGLSRFKGVCFSKAAGKWEAYICPDGKKIHLGLFESEQKAAKAYDVAARKYFGESASLNFP